MDDFEQFLTSQPLRAVPPAWRAEILATATAAANSTPAATEPWWRAWLWPSPYAWGTLAAAWLVIFGLNFASQPNSNRELASGPALTQQEFLAVLVERRRLLDEFYSVENTKPAPPPAKLPDSPGTSLNQLKPEPHPLA
jgi:hypothetical protein